MLDDENTNEENGDNEPNSEQAIDRNRLAKPDEIASLVKQRFLPLPLIVKQEASVKFERVVVYDIYAGDENSPFKIKILDHDLSVNGKLFPSPEDATKEQRQIFAESFYNEFTNSASDRLDLSPKKFDLLTHIALENLVDEQVFVTSENFNALNFPKGLAEELNIVDILENLPPAQRFRHTPVDLYPSIFDIKFNGPTALIIRSNLENFHFRPDPFHFRNPRDSIYYRNQTVSEDLKTISIINAYHDGITEPNEDGSIPRKATPDNQEHKVDFQMIQSQWSEYPQDGTKRWLMLPVIIDPPLNNGGGD